MSLGNVKDWSLDFNSCNKTFRQVLQFQFFPPVFMTGLQVCWVQSDLPDPGGKARGQYQAPSPQSSGGLRYPHYDWACPYIEPSASE